MINDQSLQDTNTTQDTDKRQGKLRTTYDGEAVLRWSHDFNTPVRYAVVDRSEGGLRIISHFPLNEGMTGLITRYLPEGKSVNQPVMVAWASDTPDDDGYHCGIWFFGTT
ncbi:MAG: hypothetical protein QF444_05800 [Phycisphaerales bacterium]|jgi:hypothetical protein|nr:hypothetical protein [Phycisphaerales bacterium]MDP6693824.1 hypothetical protein [Phycisphaerales bacterium]